jgi:hypothetical protein
MAGLFSKNCMKAFAGSLVSTKEKPRRDGAGALVVMEWTVSAQ